MAGMAREEPADARQLQAMLAPYPSAGMTCWPVSARVGNVKNNNPSLIEPVAVGTDAVVQLLTGGTAF